MTLLGQGLLKIKILNHIIKLNPIVTKTVILKFHAQRHLTFLDFHTFRIGDVSPLCMPRAASVSAGLNSSALQPEQAPEPHVP